MLRILRKTFVRFSFCDYSFGKYSFLKELGLSEVNKGSYYDGKWHSSGKTTMKSINPATEEVIAETIAATPADYQKTICQMVAASSEWASIPMPRRGEIVRQIGDAFRVKKSALGRLISLEMGKIQSQGLGEVQETIDICDMACGLSRTIGGSVFNSERTDHFMMEVWNPIGITGVITAFNFPNAVFGWNAAISLICGNSVVWKGSPGSSLVTVATSKIIADVLKKNKINPNVFTVVHGGADIGALMSKDSRIPLVSFTGSTKVGSQVRRVVSERFGRTLLQLGGNNAAVIMEDANLELAFKACTFAAVGTCGQRCTTLRRLLIHRSVYKFFLEKLSKAYSSICVGDPLDLKTLCGPLSSFASLQMYEETIQRIKKEGGKIVVGGKRVARQGYFVQPTIVQAKAEMQFLKDEFFCPIMFVIPFDTLQEAIKINNNVPQGLSSSLFTNDVKNVFKWTGVHGSDCGIVNVNIGPSGAEIGGAFGGEKATGGGREAGSDSWKQYMRRSTCTINFGKSVPLAQGVNFDL